MVWCPPCSNLVPARIDNVLHAIVCVSTDFWGPQQMTIVGSLHCGWYVQVCHSSKQWSGLLYRAFGLRLDSVFDTQQANYVWKVGGTAEVHCWLCTGSTTHVAARHPEQQSYIQHLLGAARLSDVA